MPRILILHASVGTGHKSAAVALGEAFELKQHGEVRVEDALDYGSAIFRRSYSGAYLQLSGKTPMLWKLFYEGLDIDDAELAMLNNRLRGLVERALVSALEKLVRDYKPEAIVCTHPLPVEVLLRLKLDGRLRAPIYCVITDYVAHSFWLNTGVERYFVASALTRDELIARGVTPALLSVSGIPVKLAISQPKAQAETRVSLGLPVAGPVVTLFGGGIDPRRVRLMVSRILSIGMGGVLAVVAGRSEEISGAIADLHGDPQTQLLSLGFVNYVDDLVAASDLVITKSGGLIVSEILARGTPMLVIDPIPGQEEWNADYVVSVGAGVQVRMSETVPYAVQNLLAHPPMLTMMREQAVAFGRPRAALDIAEQVLNDLASGEHH